MESSGANKLVGMAMILMFILGASVEAQRSDCSKYCAGECFDAKLIYQCISQCLKICRPPSLSKPALDCALGCANSKCNNLASGNEMTACVDSCSKNCNK